MASAGHTGIHTFRFLTRDQAARILGCSNRHIDALIALGCFQSIRIGRKIIRIEQKSFEEFLRVGVVPKACRDKASARASN